MKHLMLSLICVFAVAGPTAAAFDGLPRELDAQLCYGHAMVGFDSVINSRLGVPAENALDLASKNPLAVILHEQYSTYLLKVIWGAYLWNGNPHDYAVGVFYRCAEQQGQNTRLGLNGD
ncbi:MAG: hypothetical protein AABZ84_05705 [Pseudomonadota bacterium]